MVLGWPKTPAARYTRELAEAARSEAGLFRGKGRGDPQIVGYKDYLNGVSWELGRPIPVAAYRGELEPEFVTRPEVRDALFWSAERFWAEWRAGRPVLALVRGKELVEMMTATPPGRVVRWSGRHAIVANW